MTAGKYTEEGTGKQYRCGQKNYKTKGGEGSIYIIDQTVCKICHPGKMIEESKFTELNALNHPKIIRPERRLLDSSGDPVGYTMKLVPGSAQPLARILTKQYREREGVTPEIMAELVRQVCEGTRFIHDKGNYLLVDANEFNFMVPTDDYKSVYFIDTPSYETPSHPATAIMLSIRDPKVGQDGNGRWLWSQGSDWYSIAILTFYMFTGIHPYKGDHPKYQDIRTFWQDQMKDNVSVLHDGVTVPTGACYEPFDAVIPGGKDGAFFQWYLAVLRDGKRLPAPESFQATLQFVATIKEIVGSNNFEIKELHNLSSTVVGYYARSGREVLVTKEHILSGGRKWRRPPYRFRCGFTPVMNVPYSCEYDKDNATVRLTNLDSGDDIPIELTAKDIMSTEGRVYVLGEKNIFEITFIEKPNFFVASAHEVCSIYPSATQMFQGCAVQEMFGQYQFSVFPKTKQHFQFQIEELEGHRIIDAKYESGVLMVVATDANGEYHRFVFRIKDDRYEVLRKVENINHVGLNFTVSEKGICACINEETKVEIFHAQHGANTNVKVIADPAIDSTMRLCHNGTRIQFARGEKVYSLSLK